MPPVAAVLPLERTDELLLEETLEELRELLLLPEERTAELLLLPEEEERTAELLLEDRVEELLLPLERTEELLPEDRVLLLLFLLRSCCTAEELLERVLLLLLEERTDELLPEDRVLEEPEDREEEEEPEPVDRLLEEELVDRLPLVERVWATIFSEASRERTSIREVAMLTNFLIASQF